MDFHYVFVEKFFQKNAVPLSSYSTAFQQDKALFSIDVLNISSQLGEDVVRFDF